MKQPRDDNARLVEKALEALAPDHSGRGIVEPLDELSERRLAEAVLNRFEREPSTPRPISARRWTTAAAVIAVMGCGGLAFALLFAATADPEPLSLPPVLVERSTPQAAEPPKAETQKADAPSGKIAIPGSRFALLFGDVFAGDNAVTLGRAIPTAERIATDEGQTALSLPTGIAAGLAENTSVRVFWDGDKRYGLSVLHGMVLFSVNPSLARDGFFVDTPAGTVHVRGTLFTVIVSPGEGVFVKLHRGEVEVERPGHTRQMIVPGEVVRLAGRRSVDPAMKEKMMSQLRALRCIDEGSLFTELSHFECLEKAHWAAGKSSPSRWSDGDEVARAEAAPSIKKLMQRARRQKSLGDWAGAASSYEQLIDLYPASDEARTSLVSLARIQLKHLGDARASFRQFSRYLERAAGPLEREALFGKSEALRAMGDSLGEVESLRRFLAVYPTGLYAESVKRRLRELGAD